MLTRGKAKKAEPDPAGRHGPRLQPTSDPREEQEEEEEPEELGSVGPRNNEGIGAAELWVRFFKRHSQPIMSYATTTTLAAFLSVVVVSWFGKGPVDKEEIIQGLQRDFVADVTRRSTSAVMKDLQGDFAQNVTRNATTAAQRLLQGQLQAAQEEWSRVGTQAMEKFNETLEQKLKNVEIQSQTNLTEFQKRMLQMMDTSLKEKMDEFFNKFAEKTDAELKRKMATLRGDVDAQINQTTMNLTEKMEEMKSSLSDVFSENLRDVRKVMGEVERKTGRLETLAEKIDTQQSFLEQVMESKGFMKIDFFGPVIFGMALLEMLIIFAACMFFNRGVAGRNTPQQQRQQPRPDTQASQATSPPESSQRSPPPRLMDTHNRVVTALCFRDADKGLTLTLGRQLVEGSGDPKPRLKTFVVDSMEDIRHIPACRAALVFVDPDEREMIIEDERYHIGQGLRRHAVQLLLDSRVEVFVVIFNDRKSEKLPPSQLYNAKLGQVDEHAQLVELQRRKRVFSIKDKIHDHQRAAIVAEFNAIFA